MNINVIIPVYNVEKYLRNCIESVLNQSYQNYTIILVDDGSTDDSGLICDEYANKNEKITVIHKKNGGLSDARNSGTEIADCDYITWLDSDDTIHKDFLKILVNLAEENNADIVAGEILSYKENSEIIYPKKYFSKKTINGHSALKEMLRGRLHSTSACGMLVKTEIAKKYLFPFGKYHEDDFTTYKFYLEASTVAYTDQPLYFYLQRQGSIMHKSFGNADLDELDAADEIYNVCEKIGKDYEKAALIKKFGNYSQILFKFDDLKIINRDTYIRISSFINANICRIMLSNDIGIKKKIKIILSKFGLLKILKYIKQKNV